MLALDPAKDSLNLFITVFYVEILEGVDPSAILENIERISTSKIEIDVPASHILNRLEINTKKSDHENPGIESIWTDERLRREKTDVSTVKIYFYISVMLTQFVSSRS